MRKRKLYSALGSILWTALFLMGLTFVFLFLFGYRYDTKKREVFSSGVLSAETYPISSVFLDGNFIGETPIVKKGGIRIGRHDICFEQTGYKVRCEKIYIDSEKILFLPLFSLIPEKMEQRQWGKEQDFFFDSDDRGFFSYDFQRQIIWGIDFLSDKNIIKEVISNNVVEFVLPKSSFFSFYTNPKSVSFLGKNIFEKNMDTPLFSFDEVIEKVYEDEKRAILLVKTQNNIFLLQKNRREIVHISLADEGARFFYAEKKGEIFWVKEGILLSIVL